jgi:hypothetical protein
MFGVSERKTIHSTFNIDDIPRVFLAREVRHRQSGRPKASANGVQFGWKDGNVCDEPEQDQMRMAKPHRPRSAARTNKFMTHSTECMAGSMTGQSVGKTNVQIEKDDFR